MAEAIEAGDSGAGLIEFWLKKMINAIKKHINCPVTLPFGESRSGAFCKRLGWAIIFLLLPILIFGQTKVVANLGKTTVGKNQSFTLKYTITGEAEDFSAPNFQNNFTQVGSPSQGSEYRNINGKTSNLIYITYTLRPKRVGSFTIGPATVISKGKSYTSNSVKITVTEQASASAQPNSIEAKAAKNNQLIISISPRVVYVGQPVNVTYKVISRYGLYGLDILENPEITGFAKEGQLKQIQETSETIDGKRYRVYTFEKTVLIAQKAQTITGLKVSVELLSGEPTGRKDWWGQPEMKRVKHVVSKRLPKITVKSLPANAPVTFTGAVGKFSLDVSLSRRELQADESATLGIKITGTGNTKFVDLPKINIPDDLETYDPKYSEKIGVGRSGYKGYKKNEYLIIPRYKGSYKIPVVTFTYFNVESKKYVTLQSQSQELKVLSGPENTAASKSGTANGGIQKDRIELMNNDILFIKTNAAQWHKKEPPFYGSNLYYILLYFGLAGLAAPWFVFGLGKKLKKMGVFSGEPSAGKEIKLILKLAQKAQAANRQAEMMAHLHKALQLAVKGATNLSDAELNPQQIALALAKKGVAETDSQEFLELWETIEMVRFAPLQKEDESAILSSVKTITDKLLAA